MTDRYAAYIVVLADDIREDDAEASLNALRMVKGVASVEPVLANYEIQVGQSRANAEWRQKILDLLR